MLDGLHTFLCPILRKRTHNSKDNAPESLFLSSFKYIHSMQNISDSEYHLIPWVKPLLIELAPEAVGTAHKICAIKHSAAKHQGQPSYILTANTVSKTRLVTSSVQLRELLPAMEGTYSACCVISDFSLYVCNT